MDEWRTNIASVQYYGSFSENIETLYAGTWHEHIQQAFQIAKFMGPTRGPPGSCRPQMGPMLT